MVTDRIIEAVKRKIFLLIGRAVLTAVTNSGKVQRIQVSALKEEIISDVERMQPYGFESYPIAGSAMEVTLLCPNGNRDQAIAICITDRENRPVTLAEGDVMVWNRAGDKVWLKNDGTIRIEDAGRNTLVSSGDIWTINGNLTVQQ